MRNYNFLILVIVLFNGQTANIIKLHCLKYSEQKEGLPKSNRKVTCTEYNVRSTRNSSENITKDYQK